MKIFLRLEKLATQELTCFSLALAMANLTPLKMLNIYGCKSLNGVFLKRPRLVQKCHSMKMSYSSLTFFAGTSGRFEGRLDR